MTTPGEALAKLLKTRTEGGDTESAEKEFVTAQNDWAKKVSSDGTTRIEVGGKVFIDGKEEPPKS